MTKIYGQGEGARIGEQDGRQTAREQGEREKAEKREKFLQRDSLQSVNMTLTRLFNFVTKHKIIDTMEQEGGELAMIRSDETATAQSIQDFRLQILYGPTYLKRAMQRTSDDETLTPPDAAALQDYELFFEIFTNHPELRPRLLIKMMYVMTNWDTDDEGHDWVMGRQTFGQMLYEFYGTEEKDGRQEMILKMEGQTDLLEAWNMVGNWGFKAEEFAVVRQQIPKVREQLLEYVDRPLVVPVLTPRLADFEQTMQAHLQLFYSQYRRVIASFEVVEAASENIRLHPGRDFNRGLTLGLVDLGSNMGELIEDETDDDGKVIEKAITVKQMADFSVLAAVALQTRRVSLMNGNIRVAGFEVLDVESEEWSRNLILHVIGEGQDLDVEDYWRHGRDLHDFIPQDIPLK